MRKILIIIILFIVNGALFINNAAAENQLIVVTTSLLENAIYDIKPDNAELEVIVLLPPASCPGHFDLSPRIVPSLRSASMIVRHDYQAILEEKISDLTDKSLIVRVISTESSPLIPGNYYDLVAEMSNIMIELFPQEKAAIESNVNEVKMHIQKIGNDMESARKLWAGKSVISGTHVSELCGWLGLEVVGILKRPEETTPADLAALVKLDANLIVGNLQEGTQTAFSLGQKMNIPVIEMSNFPDVTGFGKTYYDLIHENIDRLATVWQKQ
ncbi:metal ABC transporter solute-binding protein, Zn/Mn family [Candidatus Latescibacterota bacterium]